MAEHHLAVLMLEMLIEPQARTGLVRTEASCVASELVQQGEHDPLACHAGSISVMVPHWLILYRGRPPEGGHGVLAVELLFQLLKG